MGHRIVCYGDSNTYGYNPRSYLGGRYPEAVRWILDRYISGDSLGKVATGLEAQDIPSPYKGIQVES